jgi:hypothetical protein
MTFSRSPSCPKTAHDVFATNLHYYPRREDDGLVVLVFAWAASMEVLLRGLLLPANTSNRRRLRLRLLRPRFASRLLLVPIHVKLFSCS